MKVPFLDLARQHLPIKDEIEAAIKEVVLSGNFILGRRVRELEKKIAEYCDVNYGVGVASGTDACELALRALEIGVGDGVIIPTYTFFAPAEAISSVGAQPFFLDINPKTYNLDPRELKIFLTRECSKKSGMTIHQKTGLRIKGVMLVHLFGQCAPMEEILELANEYNLLVIEDSAQSIGAKQFVNGEWRKSGSFGLLGCLSFYPSKNLSALGDGGMILTNNENLAKRLQMLRNHGSIQKNFHHYIGTNSRLDAIQAAVLLVKFKYLQKWNEARLANANYYSENLKGLVELPLVLPNNRSVFNQYVIKTPQRDELRRYLSEKGIGTEIYYPLPLHLQPVFKPLGYRTGDFPNSERCAQENLALPVFPELSESERSYIVDCIRSFFDYQASKIDINIQRDFTLIKN